MVFSFAIILALSIYLFHHSMFHVNLKHPHGPARTMNFALLVAPFVALLVGFTGAFVLTDITTYPFPLGKKK
ncbi:hypothetical protein TELCIR_04581 [Teladorsagia circumcincta]|uniref:Uncharacterized protein n=1 Tax=Teladorsagia circumcincta TaxID=45464 RepID=A0A2G9UUQ8_TELCI|nr:hypothetical protein TELCIR_04581 [Teladorsagia circumcincta]